MGDPGFIAADQVSSVQDSVSELQIDIPASAPSGARAVLVASLAPATATDPPGWTRIFDTSEPPGSTTASGGRMIGWTAEIGSQQEVDPGETVTLEMSGATRAVAGIAVYGPSDVVDVEIGPVSTMGATGPFTRTTPVAQADDIARALHIYGVNGNNASNDSISWEADPATTERLDVASEAPNFRNVTLMVADEQAGPGAVGERTATASHRAQACAVTVVLSTTVDRPTATASTPTPTVAAGTPGVQLLGEAANGAGPPFTYQWRQISGPVVALSDPTAQSPTFTAPGESAELVFGLVVTDADDVSSLETTVTITVVAAGDTAVPIGDVITDGWSTEPDSAPTVAAVVGDSDDGTYAYYYDPIGAVLELRLSELALPQAGEPVDVVVRVSQVEGSQGSVTLQLREGDSTVIAQSGPHQWSAQSTVQEFAMRLTPAEVASISDPSDLRVRITGTVT